MVRYEDLILDMKNTIKNLMGFIGLGLEKSTEDIIEKAEAPQVIMKLNKKEITQTPALIMNKWRFQLNMNEVFEIQNKCISAMKVWSYKIATRPEHLVSKDLMGQF